MRGLEETVRPSEKQVEVEEGVKIRGTAVVVGPSREEYEDHMRTHIPFRSWFQFCVKGKCKGEYHRAGNLIKRTHWRET